MPIGIPKDTATGDLPTGTITPESLASSLHIAHGAPPHASRRRPSHRLHLDRRENHG